MNRRSDFSSRDNQTVFDPYDKSDREKAEAIMKGLGKQPPIATGRVPLSKQELFRVSVNDGKYTLIAYKDGGLEAFRYGEKWRDLTGDGLVFQLGCALNGRIAEALNDEEPNYTFWRHWIMWIHEWALFRMTDDEAENRIGISNAEMLEEAAAAIRAAITRRSAP